MKAGVRLYCGLGEVSWNGIDPMPGKYVCVSPVYGRTRETKQKTYVKVPKNSLVLVDSGAFSDAPEDKPSASAAFERQVNHINQFGYHPLWIATNDVLIDEFWIDGVRFKRRWDEESAKDAVVTTIEAARWLRNHYSGPKVMSAQGVTRLIST